MADGALIGRRAALGQVAHTDGTATTVVTLAVPQTDGYYPVIGRFGGGTSTGTNAISGVIMGTVRRDNIGGETVVAQSQSADFGATGYSATISANGGNVVLTVTAANGQRSVAMLELFGVEFALTLA